MVDGCKGNCGTRFVNTHKNMAKHNVRAFCGIYNDEILIIYVSSIKIN